MMTESVKSKAESVQCELGTLRVLVDAVDTKVGFFITEKSLFGGYSEWIRSFALDIQALLSVITREIWDMERDQDEVVRMLTRERQGGEA